MTKHPSISIFGTWGALLAVSLGIFTITLDGSMMPVAIGSIVDDLNTQVAFVQAAMALHSLVMASTYLAAGKLALKYGEKRIFVLGALVFAAGVILAALSPNIWLLILGWSLIKPVGGAMMIPAASSLIVLNYAGQQRTTAFGIFSAFVAAAAVIGPVWMGAMANLISWRWAFASEPLLILLLLFFASMVTETKREQRVPFDSLGALLTFIGFGLLVLGATLAGEFGWWSARRPFYIGAEVFAPFGLSAALVFMLGGGAVLLAYAGWSELRARRKLAPLFRVSIFRNRNFSVAAALGLCFQLAVGGLLFVLPVFLQSALFLDALDTGLVLLPYTLGIFVFALGASRLPARISPVLVVRIGLILMLVGGWWVYQTASLQLVLSSLVPALFCFGAGAGMVLARLTEITLAEVQPEELGEATGGDSTGKELGVAFGVSVLGSIFLALMFGRVGDGYFEFHGQPVVTAAMHAEAAIELEDWAARITDDQWKAFLDRLPDVTGNAYEAIVADAYLSAYQDTLVIIMGVILVMMVVSLGFRRGKRHPAGAVSSDD
jgi:MFS family permease